MFTIDKLANALRGMPRDARVMVRLPGGGMVNIASVETGQLYDRAGQTETPTPAPTFGVVLVVGSG